MSGIVAVRVVRTQREEPPPVGWVDLGRLLRWKTWPRIIGDIWKGREREGRGYSGLEFKETQNFLNVSQSIHSGWQPSVRIFWTFSFSLLSFLPSFLFFFLSFFLLLSPLPHLLSFSFNLVNKYAWRTYVPASSVCVCVCVCVCVAWEHGLWGNLISWKRH